MCEKCGVAECLGKWKYCKECKAIVVAEMKKSGYLQYTNYHHKGECRTSEMKENTYQTIHGTGY